MKLIKLAIRSILSFRTYSGINLSGLALSLACVITIFRYVYGEFTVDRFCENLDRIYVTTRENNINRDVEFSGINYRDEERTFFKDLTEHPGVENYAHCDWFETEEINVDDRKYYAALLIADSNFLKIVDYPVISGIDRLSEPNNALITKSFAQKIFGDQNPVGKKLQLSTREIVTITGLIGQTSTKRTFSFDVVVSLPRWRYQGRQTFVLLHPGIDYRAINNQYDSFFGMPRWGEYQMRYQLFPLSKVYFEKNIRGNGFKQGNHNYVTMLTAVGALILLAGIICYINIYTVIILRRRRELGIKKVFGAARHNIFIQLLAENLLMTGLALVAALLIANVAYPFITNRLQLDQIHSIRFDFFLSLNLLLLLPLLATLYPFFRHHYSMSVNSLRNIGKIRDGGLHRVFLSFQYMITIVMIVVSLFFIKQLRFMLNADLGYRTTDIIKTQFLRASSYGIISMEQMDEYRKKSETENLIADEIAQKMNACPLFTQWTYGQSPNKFTKGNWSFKLPEGELKQINLIRTDAKWLKLFDIQLKEGRLWDEEKDDYEGYNIIVTESVLKLYGITDFNNALLQAQSRIWINSNVEQMSSNPPFRIVGVVKDLNNSHLSQLAEPIIFHYSGTSRNSLLMASIVPGKTQEAIVFLRNLHEETVGGEFTYSFVADEVREMYREDEKIASIYTIFTFIAIFVSVLGLFSMSLFDIQQRRKEIAIRKINGATIADVIRLLLKNYFRSLLISFALAAPVAFYVINRYLEGFAHKALVSWWLFGVAITLTTGVSLLTLIYQTHKAASQNPAEVIKN